MARRRGEQVEVYVTIGSLKYGFKTTKSVHNSYKSELGQTTYNGSAGVFFGANSPKPPRATKEFASGTIGSYCSTDKISSLKSNGWTVSRKARIRGVKTAGKTRTVYVDMPGGWKYAWNITASEADLASELGFVLATGADASDLIWGVNYPKPPRASKTDESGTTSTFILCTVITCVFAYLIYTSVKKAQIVTVQSISNLKILLSKQLLVRVGV